MIKFLRCIPAGVCTIIVLSIIFYATLTSNPVPGVPLFKIPGMDKIVHFVMFFTLAGATIFDYMKWRCRTHIAVKALIAIVLAEILLGCAIEWLQETSGIGRSASMWDAVADMIGTVVGILLSVYITNKCRDFIVRIVKK